MIINRKFALALPAVPRFRQIRRRANHAHVSSWVSPSTT